MTNTATAENVLRDIKPPIAIESGWEWLWWLLAGLIVAALAALLLRHFRRKETAIPVSVVPAHIRAKQQLEAAFALIAQPKPFCVAVSDTVRFYLEERFQFRAPERTTEEFLHELQATHLLLPDQKESLAEFLKQCDLVKFARYEPGETELRNLHSSALRLIEETEPQEETADNPSQTVNRGS